MAFLGMHSHTARITMALFAGMIGAAAELAVPSPPPKARPPPPRRARMRVVCGVV